MLLDLGGQSAEPLEINANDVRAQAHHIFEVRTVRFQCCPQVQKSVDDLFTKALSLNLCIGVGGRLPRNKYETRILRDLRRLRVTPLNRAVELCGVFERVNHGVSFWFVHLLAPLETRMTSHSVRCMSYFIHAPDRPTFCDC